MREYIGQQLIIGLSGTELTKEEAQFITDNNIGGVILFTRNFENLEQLHKLITDIQRLRYQLPNQTPLFISVDMEGGRVQRFKDPFTISRADDGCGAAVHFRRHLQDRERSRGSERGRRRRAVLGKLAPRPQGRRHLS